MKGGKLEMELNGLLRHAAIGQVSLFPGPLAEEIFDVLHSDSIALAKKQEQHKFSPINRFVANFLHNTLTPLFT